MEGSAQNAVQKPGKVTLNEFCHMVFCRCCFARLDGVLHYYNGVYFIPIKSQSDLEALIFRLIPNLLDQVSLKTLSNCARVIFKLYPFPNLAPSEAEGYLGFANGICQYDQATGVFSEFFPFPQEAASSAPLLPPQSEAESSETQEDPVPLPQFRVTHLLNANFIDLHRFHAPATKSFLGSIAGNDQTLYKRLWEMIACILVPDPAIQRIFLLSGAPDSGIEVFCAYIRSFFPKEILSFLPPHRLGDRNSPTLLTGIYLNLSSDLPNRPISPAAIALMKRMTGKEDVSGEIPLPSGGVGRCRFLLSSRHPLYLTKADPAFLEQLVVIPFPTSLPSQMQSPQFLETLKEERDSVGSFAFQMVLPWLKAQGMQFSGADRPDLQPQVLYTLTYSEQQESQISQFIHDCCRLTGSDGDFTYTEDLYESYKAFCDRESYAETYGIRQFSRVFGRLVAPQARKRKQHTSETRNGERFEKNQNGYIGLLLQSPDSGS